MGSHTDSRGNNEYNLELSENRAKAAVEYIIKNGISSNRIQSKGYGETVLTNRCKDGVVCSEADHQNNRRTELKILGIQKDPNDEKGIIDMKSIDGMATIKGIEFAMKNNAKIINASFGAYIKNETMERAINEYTKRGGLFVTSAGNNGAACAGG